MAAIQTTGATFQKTNANDFVYYDNIKFLEYVKEGLKVTFFWDKYKSQKTTQPENNNLDSLIDQTFRNVNRLFVLSLKNGNNNPMRYFLMNITCISRNKRFLKHRNKTHLLTINQFWSASKNK